MMGTSMYGFGIWGLLLNILIVFLVVWVTVTLLNKSGTGSSENNERLARVEKDVEDIKKMVQDIKDKLDEI
ncbi:hypothetical protein [Methanolobus bombayensis]|uniref:hypothetical protein n=1 Tax=Methanolobus bombayensis TaxID=38023 RepID=UPI001AE188B1|nr:hypothetical protein [Methanolobus bombayensis]MBP1908645.1 large-conductance mechanosensitive channel [Methanolobus bombayensis]